MNKEEKSCLWPTFYNGYITGRVESCVLFDSFPKDLVSELLPDGFCLAEQNISPKSTHPVYWCFNLHQSRVGTPIPFLCLNYHEFAFVIPFVQYGDQADTMGAYSPTLYLDSLMGVLGGRILFQLPKHDRSCHLSAKTFYGEEISMSVESNKDSKPTLEGFFKKEGNPINSSSAPFKHVQSMLDQRLISDGWLGRRASTFKLFYDNVAIYPISSVIKTGGFLPGFSDMNRTIAPIDVQPLGGLYFDVNWKLLLPKRL